MSFSTILTAAVFGMKVEFVHVEADVSNGIPAFHMVGYLSSEVKEAAERVQTAIRNSGIDYPPKKTIVNLSPATMRKRGASFDLPVAVSILVSLGVIMHEKVQKTLIIGEMSLDGKVRSVPGILPIVLAAKEEGVATCLIPKDNVEEGMLAGDIQLIGVESLREVVGYLKGTKMIENVTDQASNKIENEANEIDYADVYGQKAVKRAAEIAEDEILVEFQNGVEQVGDDAPNEQTGR